MATNEKSFSQSYEANYLAARQALYFNDVRSSADFYLAALGFDNNNSNLLKQSFLTQYITGNIDKAAALARQMELMNLSVSNSSEPATAQAIIREDWDAVEVLSNNIAETVEARPIAGIIKAWALAVKGQQSRR